MVTLRKGTLALAAALGLLGGLAGSSLAGTGPVQVFGNWARGDLGAAHNAGGGQYIGCWANSDPAGPPLLYCEVNDGAGNFNFCFTQNSNLMSVLQTIQSTSDLQFGWGPDHTCLWLTIGHYSQSPGRRS
jgi:hypothetical protein